MKKILPILCLCLGVSAFAQEQSPVAGDRHNYIQGPGGGSSQFAGDIAILPSSVRQHGTSISVAFNGWIYEATGLESMDSDSSGGLVRMSRDNGFTWTTIVNYYFAGIDYINPEIEVTGTDTSSLFLFVASAWFDTSSNVSVVWVDKYNATTGAFIGEPYNESMINPVRDIDIASDYKFPAWGSSPYGVAILYSHLSGSADSVIYVSSGDAGITWNNRRVVASTILFTDQVSLAYGISNWWSNGRYFAAWEERTNFNDAIGKIKTAHCATTFDGTWTSPISLDSLDSGISGVVRRPAIACMQSTALNNDSNGLSVIVVFERAWGGDTADCDILGFYSKSQPNSNFWYRYDVVNNASQTIQPDVAYDPAYNNFLLTYFNRSMQEMPYLVHEYNMISPYTWVTITSNYCDQPATLRNPFPRVAINPVLIQAAFSWTRIMSNREQAMFDAEYVITSAPEPLTVVNELNLYPNPANSTATLSYYLAAEGRVGIDVYAADGSLVLNVLDQSMNEGEHRIDIPVAELANGMYLVKISNNGYAQTKELLIAH